MKINTFPLTHCKRWSSKRLGVLFLGALCPEGEFFSDDCLFSGVHYDNMGENPRTWSVFSRIEIQSCVRFALVLLENFKWNLCYIQYMMMRLYVNLIESCLLRISFPFRLHSVLYSYTLQPGSGFKVTLGVDSVTSPNRFYWEPSGIYAVIILENIKICHPNIISMHMRA